ncbi:MAG: Gfo/Idh/MocA family oxidoreductase [Planctomycetes bacterium]|nr:Gfo/Idh/MocA family oxidoreductase [Planctomycetota bacterium]
MKPTRRHFLKTSLTAAAASSLPAIISPHVLGATARTAPSDKIRLGVIGIGPRATHVLGGMFKLPEMECVAIADVQASRRNAGKTLVDKQQGNEKCKLYRDFRELLDRKDIDAVLIATGDRWHAPASILAAEAGKDVYSEKPCGLTIANCQEVEAAMKKTGRVYQAGTQRRSVPNFQQAVQLAQTGKLGKLQTLYASVYMPVLKNDWLPAESVPPRDVVDWNLWLGTAPWRPYNPAYVRGGWRGYFDFESGARLLDWGAHTVDLCQWANSADDTMPVEYEPSDTNVTCRYANGVKLVLDFLPNPFKDRRPNWNNSVGICPVKFVGEAGSVETGDKAELDLKPESLRSELPPSTGKIDGLDVVAHARNFFDCIKNRGKTICNPSVMRHSHITCHATALSWILKRKLTFDPSKEEFVGDAEANGLRSRAPREWKIG